MIQPLRTVHRRAFVALALLLPAILLVGLGARHPSQRSSAPAAQLPNSAHMLRKSDTLWQKQTMRSEFYGDSNRSQVIYVVLKPERDLSEPDLLLYWAAKPPQGNALPEDVQFVGSYAAGKAFTLPLNVGKFNSERAGYLVLFSLAHHTVFDTARVETLP